MAKRELSEHAKAAKQIRGWLKENGIKGARVTSKSYAGGSSVDVVLQDPTPLVLAQVEAFVGQYQYGHFDGMQDLYEYSNSRKDLPQVKFTFVRVEYSVALRQRAWDFVRDKWGGFDDTPRDVTEIPHDLQHEGMQESALLLIRKALSNDFQHEGFWPDEDLPSPTPESSSSTSPTLVDLLDQMIRVMEAGQGEAEIAFLNFEVEPGGVSLKTVANGGYLAGYWEGAGRFVSPDSQDGFHCLSFAEVSQLKQAVADRWLPGAEVMLSSGRDGAIQVVYRGDVLWKLKPEPMDIDPPPEDVYRQIVAAMQTTNDWDVSVTFPACESPAPVDASAGLPVLTVTPKTLNLGWFSGVHENIPETITPDWVVGSPASGSLRFPADIQALSQTFSLSQYHAAFMPHHWDDLPSLTVEVKLLDDLLPQFCFTHRFHTFRTQIMVAPVMGERSPHALPALPEPPSAPTWDDVLAASRPWLQAIVSEQDAETIASLKAQIPAMDEDMPPDVVARLNVLTEEVCGAAA